LFPISSSVWLVFGEDVFGITFEFVGVNVSSVPYEVLEELVAILLLHNDTSGLDDILDILNKFATFGAEFFLVDRGMVENILQRVVDLSVVGQPPIAECLNNAVKSELETEVELQHGHGHDSVVWTYLAIDISSLVTLVDWLDDSARSRFLSGLLGSGR